MTKKSISQNIDIDGKKAIVLIGTFFIFFVLPISVLSTNYSSYPKEVSTEQTGRVAGVETSAQENNKQDSTSSIFLIVGILSLSVTLILSTYLLVSSSRNKKVTKKN